MSPHFGLRGAPVFSDLTFDLRRGERLAVLGPNGGGKTTLFKLLLGELPLLAGELRAEGGLGYVPQTERSRLDFPVSALDVALMGTLSRLACGGGGPPVSIANSPPTRSSAWGSAR